MVIGTMEKTMQEAIKDVIRCRYPRHPFHSTRASALKTAVEIGYIKELHYLECTFSLIVKRVVYDSQTKRSKTARLGHIVVTIEEDVNELLGDITVSFHLED